MSYKLLILLVTLLPISILCQVNVNVKEFGAEGNNLNNDWESIQKAIDYVINKGGGIVNIPNGTYIIEDKTLLIWGDNVKLLGESKDSTILKRKGKEGWWGELLSVSGKSKGGKYFGSFGKSNYNKFIIYNGETKPANNIFIQNLTFDNVISYPSLSNNLAISNGNNVNIENCLIKNAPQTNLAIVNVSDKTMNNNIKINNCEFVNSGQHNVRVISYNQGKKLGNSVEISNSIFQTVRYNDNNKEIRGKKVHLWYRAGLGSENISLKINKCTFDNTGMIVSTINANNLTIVNSVINNNIYINSSKQYLNSKVLIENNIFKKSLKNSILTNLKTIDLKGNIVN